MALKKFSITEYEIFLKNLMEEISQNDTYNIFMHCVTIHTEYFLGRNQSREEEIKKRLKGIKKDGLNLDGNQTTGQYGSISGTTMFVNASDKINNFKNVINYDYFSVADRVHSLIIALPKYIRLSGEEVEFSTFNNTIKNLSPHDKKCLFDIVKEKYLPTSFILGYQCVDKSSGIIEFYKNERHVAFLNKKDHKNIMSNYALKCEKALKYCELKYGVKDFESVFKNFTDEHMLLIADCLNEP